MDRIAESPEFLKTQFSNLQAVLKKEGIDIPLKPHLGNQPLPWLIRAEGGIRKLQGSEQEFTPQKGRMESFGVYMADNFKPLPMQEVFYIFERDRIAQQWLASSSPQAQNIANTFSRLHHLDTSRIDDGTDAYRYLYENYPVYQEKEGICTFNLPIKVDQVYKILVHDITLELLQGRVSPNIKDKIVPFEFH